MGFPLGGQFLPLGYNFFRGDFLKCKFDQFCKKKKKKKKIRRIKKKTKFFKPKNFWKKP
jgi:hypothetical protein